LHILLNDTEKMGLRKRIEVRLSDQQALQERGAGTGITHYKDGILRKPSIHFALNRQASAFIPFEAMHGKH
jgi:hypothetical protein